MLALQAILATIACGCTAALAVRIARRFGLPGVIVALGAAARALAAFVLFWVSYLDLPFARAMQLGNGFWFFSLDGTLYVKLAATSALHPLANLPLFSADIPSPAYIQLLTIVAVLLGSSAAIGALVNIVAYLLLGFVLARAAGGAGKYGLVIAAIYAFAPGPILWATQPLKDVPFVAAELFFPAAFLIWQRAWSREDIAWRRAVISLSLMFVAMYFMAGIRQYYALIVLAAAASGFAIVALRSPRKLRATVAAGVALAICAAAILLSSASFITLHRQKVEPTPDATIKSVQVAREGFEKTPASTAIRETKAVQNLAVPRPVKVLLTNVAAIVVPRFIGARLNLFSIGGGRGLWFFADLDTIVFDLAIVTVALALRKRFRRESFGSGVVWLIGMMLLLTLPIIYVVNNFGTLFRFRMMLLLPMLFLPLVISTPEKVSEEVTSAGTAVGALSSRELESPS